MTTAAIIADLDQRDLLSLAQRLARAHHVTVDELLGSSHTRMATRARHAFWEALRGLPDGGLNYSAIARICHRDRSAVKWALKRREEREKSE